jgi:hexosaminidase
LAWDEVADASLPGDSMIIFWWRQDKPEQLKKAFEKGYHVVLCPRIPLYFDFVQDSTHLRGRRWKGAFSSLDKVYRFSANACPETRHQVKNILGIQANLWTETVQTKRRLEYLLFPRITALAEAAWTKEDKKDYPGFLNRLKPWMQFYKADQICYYDPFSPGKTPEVIN